MNAILESVLAGDYAIAWERYVALPAPGPDDDRFGGVCLYNLQRLQPAKDLLLRARARGCAAAGIELATVLRQLGHLELSREALALASDAALDPFDGALALRERGAQLYTDGALAAASDALERAWAVSFDAAGGPALRPGIGQALGLVYAERGLDRRAAGYFEAALASANPARAVYLRTGRALSLLYLGDDAGAGADLAAAEAGLEHVPVAAPYLRWVQGAVHRALGRLEPAEARLREATAGAREAQEPETECYAELELCALATTADRGGRARAHLARARNLAANDKMRALVALREGALAAREGRDEAVPLLLRSAAQFAGWGLAREEGWSWLHLAEAYLRTDRHGEAHEALARASASRHATGEPAPLRPELRSTPRVVERLATALDGSSAPIALAELGRGRADVPLRLELRTLGRAELLVDGVETRLELRRSVEVLAYLLGTPAVPLSRVLVDLFPDTRPARARNYFHQVRYALARAVPGLSVPYDPASRTYRVRCDGVALRSDAQDLRDALRQGGEKGLTEALALYRGPFLPGADSEWARAEREELSWTIVQLGLEVVGASTAGGLIPMSLRLTGRLLEIEPYDEALNEALVDAVRRLEGERAARRVVSHLARRFERELGMLPPALDRLRQLN